MLRYHEWIFHSDDLNTEHKVTDILLYADETELVRIELKPVFMYPLENGTMSWADWNHYDSICIFKTDYEKFLLPSISALFPITDPDPNGFGVQESFDLTSINFFGADDWNRLIGNLTECMKAADETEAAFYRAVIEFLTDFTAVSIWFCIEGNQ